MVFLRKKSPLRRAGNYLIRQYRKLFCQELLVLGDSHANVFKQKLITSAFPNYLIEIVAIKGATVSGFENPNAKTRALPIFMERVKRSRAKTIIVLLGEVDAGFVIWYRAAKYKAPVEEMLDKAVVNYQRLLAALAKTARVICISTPLPTIRDGQDWGEIANARKEVRATQLQRTGLTLQFNMKMQDFCRENGITYLALDEESIGPDGLVDSRLLNPKSTNHHYDKQVYAEMIVKKLRWCLEPSAAPPYPSSKSAANLP